MLKTYIFLLTIFGLRYYTFATGVSSLFPNLPIAVRKTENAVCREQSNLQIESLENLTLWAHEMWDSTAKTSYGVLRANQFQFGNFEQCLSVKAPFPTKYCLAKIVANLPQPQRGLPHYRPDEFSLDFSPYESVLLRIYPHDTLTQQPRNLVQMGWCVPASCTILDLQTYLNEYLSKNQNLSRANLTYSAHFSDLFCQTAEELNKFDVADICFCILVLVLFVLVLSATVFDTNSTENFEEKLVKRSRLQQIFLAFSAKNGYRALTKKDESSEPLRILYGMRTICILLIVCGHRFGTFTSSAIMNFDYIEKQYRTLGGSFIFHSDLFVDSFFFLSGLLAAYGLLGQFSRKFLHPAFIIMMRYIRLTPVYALVIFYYATVFSNSGYGPLWKPIVGQDTQDCRDNWWTNLLYISNYVNAEHMCMAHSWYLPCDFHYFMIAIFICYLLTNRPKCGLIALSVLVAISAIIPFTITMVFERPALLHFYPEFLGGPKIHPDYLMTYIKSHTRATPYFIGMSTGYLYHKWKKSTEHISRMKSFAIVTVSIFLILVAFMSSSIFYDPYHEYDVMESASYAGLHRLAFALGTAGLLLISSYGHGTIMRKVLIWTPFVPLSKLVYGVYLVHMQFQLRAAGKTKTSMEFSYFDLYTAALADITLSFTVAFILYIGVETPFTQISKILLRVPQSPNDSPRQLTLKSDVHVTIPSSTEHILDGDSSGHDMNCDSRL